MSAPGPLLEQFVHVAFWYCTDFMVNLANLTGTSYPEANTWVPLLLAGLIGVRVAQGFALRKWRARAGRPA